MSPLLYEKEIDNLLRELLLSPHSERITNIGIHLDRRFTRHCRIEPKRFQMKLKALRLHWLINHYSKLSIIKVSLQQSHPV